MSTKVLLPPGCMGFRAADGTRYVARPGTFVHVEDRHMGALQREDYASAGLVNVNGERFFSNRSGDGRWCPDCRRLWNRWNAVCVKCGAATVTESEMDRTLPPGPYTP